MKLKVLLCFALFGSFLFACSQGNVFDLEVGDCFNLGGSNDDFITDVEVVNCSEAHEAEVYAKVNVDRSSYPTMSYFATFADEQCYDPFRSYVGVSYEESSWFFDFLYPDSESWDRGKRYINCLIIPEYGLAYERARNSRK